MQDPFTLNDQIKVIGGIINSPLLTPLLCTLGLLIIIAITKLPTRKKPIRPTYNSFEDPGASSYKTQYYLLTREELKFYKALRIALKDSQISIIPKVRVADIIKADGYGKAYSEQFNKIRSKHIDFLLCDSNNLRIIAGIELDDRSHLKKSRQESDMVKDNAFEEARIPLLRFATEKFYKPEFIEEELYQYDLL